MRALRLLAARLAALRCLRPAIPFAACVHPFAPPVLRTLRTRGQGLFSRFPSGFKGMETTRSPRFLDDPLPPLPCSSTPVGPMCQATTAPRYCPRDSDHEGPSGYSLSRLNHTASTVAAYASRLGRPARARLASGCRPALPGGIGYPQGHYRRFPSVTSLLPPSPGLSWRDAVRYVRGSYLMLPPHAVFPSHAVALLVSPFRPVTAGSFTSGGHTPEVRS
jgi:hypothetical protein